MHVKLPLYLGATLENMRKGAAIMGETSLPLGTKNSNCVIAAHRGYKGIPYFREIEKLKAGDKVTIQNPWEKLSYRVEKIKIIKPDDSDQIRIQKGKDMVTLLTCHPYRSHGKYRYLVFCERFTSKNKEKDSKKITKKTVVTTKDETITYEPSTPDIKRENTIKVVAFIFILCCIAYIFVSKIRNR